MCYHSNPGTANSMAEHTSEIKTEVEPTEKAIARGFRLLEDARTRGGVTVRDEQHEFAWLLDAAHLARRRGRRFRLVDSGAFDAFSLEWLAAAGADLYTSDDVRPDVFDLVRLRSAGRSSGAFVAFFHYGPLKTGEDGGGRGPEFLRELLLGGVDVHLSNRRKARGIEVLSGLALSRRAGVSELVYYHHGPLGPEVEALSDAGAWVHIEDAALDLKEDSARIIDLGRAFRVARGGLVLRLEKETDERIVEDFQKAGVHVLEMIPDRFPETGKSLPPRAYYLDTTFMP
ncbi:MAG: hypothetical protein JW747_00510 [Candidatus Aminicenantes bacterium]|nr:hypothetical protein [Candidatus Aminicenantes bacterium]